MSHIQVQAALATADAAFFTAKSPKSRDLAPTAAAPDFQPHTDTMRAYFSQVYADLIPLARETGAMVELKTVPANERHGSVKTAHFAPEDVDGMVAQAVAWNRTSGQNVYATPGICRLSAKGNATNDGFEAAAYAWVDIDRDCSSEDIARVTDEFQAAYVLVTGHTWGEDGKPGGFRLQALFKLPALTRDPAEIRAINRHFVEELDGDPAAVNPARVMRIPGSIAWKKERKQGRRTEVTFGGWQSGARAVDAKTVRAAVAAATVERERAWQSEIGAHPANSWVRHLSPAEQYNFLRDVFGGFNNQAAKGGEDLPRERWVKVCFGACHAETLEINGATDLFRDWSRDGDKFGDNGEADMERDIASYDPHHPTGARLGTLLYLFKQHGGEAAGRVLAEYRAKADYAKAVAELAKNRDRDIAEAKGLPVPESAADASPSLFSRRIDFAKFKGKAIPDRQWLVPAWAPVGTVTLLYATGGTGKSMLMQQLATATAIGGKWLGMSVQECKAFCYFSEDDDEELLRRQSSICRSYGTDLEGE